MAYLDNGGVTHLWRKIKNAISHGAPAHNLLDNSDFTNPVNQRGKTSYSGASIYSIDRWKIGNAATVSTINVVNGGIEALGDFSQNLEFYENLNGSVCTIAYMDGNENVYAKEFIIGKENNGTIGKAKLYSVSTMNVLFRFTSSETIRWAALYEGSYTADTLPPYMPKGYAAELAECMRYYQIIPFDFSWSNLATSAEYPSRFPVVFPQTMHNTPTVMAGGYWSSNMDANIQFDCISDRGCAFCITANNTNYSEWHGRVICSSEL